jgi:hypothetical protein
MNIKVISTQIFAIALFPMLVSGNAGLPDPTRPANYMIEDTEPVYVEAFDVNTREKVSWRLSAVRISENDKTAIVNGKLVRVGDDIDQAKVLDITLNSVVINHEDHKLIVRLFNNQVIKDYKSSK